MEGIVNIKPAIKKITFSNSELHIKLEDGRKISVPIKYFPSINKLTSTQRDRWYTLNGEGFSFDDCDEVFHIEQILGNYDDYKYSFT